MPCVLTHRVLQRPVALSSSALVQWGQVPRSCVRRGGLGEDGSLTLAPRLDAAEPSSAAAAGSTEMRQVWFGGFKSLNCSKRASALDVSVRGEST